MIISRRGKDSDYRLQVAILNNELARIAYKAGLIARARVYRPEWSHEDVTQELTAYVLHLQWNTNSGFDPARSKFSTWLTMVATGWVNKLGRRRPEPTQPAADAASASASKQQQQQDYEDFEDTNGGDPESLLLAKQEAVAEVLGIENLLLNNNRTKRT